MIEDPAERAQGYIQAFEGILASAELKPQRSQVSEEAVRRILELAGRYLEDSRHYLKAGKPTTSLASIAYAEGLVDALAMLSLVKVDWKIRRDTP